MKTVLPALKKDGSPKKAHRTVLQWASDEQLHEKIREYASNGLRDSQIAHCLEVTANAFRVAKKNHPVIAEMVDQGRSQGINRVANALFEDAIAGKTQAQIFFLKTVAGWSEQAQQATASTSADDAFALVEEEQNALKKWKAEHEEMAKRSSAAAQESLSMVTTKSKAIN